MWVFLSDAMLSIVADANDPTRLLVRARLPGDIAAVFPEASVEITPRADYRFRASIDRGEVMCKIADRLFEIDYPNFKDSVREEARHDAYMGVWSVMHRAQIKAIPWPATIARKCADCGHVQQVAPAAVDPSGARYFGSAFDFCDKCDGDLIDDPAEAGAR